MLLARGLEKNVKDFRFVLDSLSFFVYLNVLRSPILTHMSRFVFFFVLSLGFLSINAQDIALPAVPDSLSQKADAVVLQKDIHIRYLSPDKMEVHGIEKILILNKQADYLAHFALLFDKQRKINRVKLRYYDAQGRLLKRVHNDEFHKVSASGSETLYSDDRALVYSYTPVEYPYVVEKEYSFISGNTAFIPEWYPVSGYDTDILESTYEITYPSDLKLFIKKDKLKEFGIRENGGAGRLIFKARHIKPLHAEPFGPALEELVPSVRIRPSRFSLAGVQGRVSSWDDFGRWVNEHLLKGTDRLPPQREYEIRQMVAGISDPVEKAKKIYEYMQNRTRYINVAIGIGGWKPMSAADVDRLGYGDCKALTNYTRTLMEIAGIPAYYTLVYGGAYPEDIDGQLVGLQGNHAILTLPLDRDTVWLECTNQKIPFGHIAGFTDDRQVLMIEKDGAKLTHTRAYPADSSLQSTEAEIRLEAGGRISGHFQRYATGVQYDQLLSRFDGIKPTKQTEALRNWFDYLVTPVFKNPRFENKKHQGRYEMAFDFETGRYATPVGKDSLLFIPNIFNRYSHIPRRHKNRRYDIVLNRGFTDQDTYTLMLPQGYRATGLPVHKIVDTPFGRYEIHITRPAPGRIRYYRKWTMHKGRFAKEKYKDFRKFFKRIKRLDYKKILIYKS